MNTWEYKLIVDHVHDGDTIYGVIDMGLGITIGAVGGFWGVRFVGCNAPELNTPEGVKARDYLMTLVKPGDVLEIISTGWDKYGRRIDAYVYLDNGHNLSDLMIGSGNAVAYHP